MKSIKYLTPFLAMAILTTVASCSKSGSVAPVKTPAVITVSTFAGDGTIGLVNGIGVATKFNQASDLAINASGDLYVGDWLNNVVRKINLSTAAVTTFAGTGAPGFFTELQPLQLLMV